MPAGCFKASDPRSVSLRLARPMEPRRQQAPSAAPGPPVRNEPQVPRPPRSRRRILQRAERSCERAGGPERDYPGRPSRARAGRDRVVSCVVFVVITAVEGWSGSPSFTNAFCVAMAATPSMPASTAIPLSGFAKGPTAAPSVRNPARSTACTISNNRRVSRVVLSENKTPTIPSTATNTGTDRERPDLAEAAGHIVSGQNHQVAGDMCREEPSEREKPYYIDGAGSGAQGGRQ